MKPLHKLEDIAVRVMYFFNVTDTFLPFSVVLFLAGSKSFLTDQGLPSGAFFIALPACFVLIYLCFLIAEFHVFYLAGLPMVLLAGYFSHSLNGPLLSRSFTFFFILTSIVQIVFMGIPMGMAARSAVVPLRMYVHSFAIIAPTTISLPVTLGFQMFAATGLTVLSPHPLSALSLSMAGLLVVLAIAIRRMIKVARPAPPFHPAPQKKNYSRVVLLNIDGLSHHAFSKAGAPFLQLLEKNFLHAEGGATTVYKAFTNPAFASILTGTEPARHGVYNNNFGQTIRSQALPDIMPTRLYGSMHVKHFSRPDWNVNLVSLVTEGHDRADPILVNRLKEDLINDRNTALWIVDFSMADYCGHAWGGYSRRYYHAIEKLDALIRDFFLWCKNASLLNDTLFILSSDHGLFIGEHAYLLSRKEKYVPLAFIGNLVCEGEILVQASIMDIAANVCYGLGRPYPVLSGGRVFEGVAGYTGAASFEERLGLSKGRPG